MALPVTPPSQVVPLRESPPQVAVLPKPSQPVRHARPRPHKSAPSLPLEALISQWHSPTEFLLRKPGTALLNTVPRLGESFIKSKTLVPEQHNYLEEQ